VPIENHALNLSNLYQHLFLFKKTHNAIGDQIYKIEMLKLLRCAKSSCVLHDEFEEMLEYKNRSV
jgi:hypothetical protein